MSRMEPPPSTFYPREPQARGDGPRSEPWAGCLVMAAVPCALAAGGYLVGLAILKWLGG